MNSQHWFIYKSKEFRIHFNLTEADIDVLLAEKGISYTGLELGTKTLTLDIAEAYPLIYGLDYCEFKKDETSYPIFEKLPKATQDHINNRKESVGKNVGLKGTKNRASYIIFVIKDFPVGYQFLNIDIVKDLPHPLSNDGSITWNNGLLKGLVKSTGKYKSYIGQDGKTTRSIIYELVKSVSPHLFEKAKKNIDEEWLKSFKNKKKKS